MADNNIGQIKDGPYTRFFKELKDLNSSRGHLFSDNLSELRESVASGNAARTGASIKEMNRYYLQNWQNSCATSDLDEKAAEVLINDRIKTKASEKTAPAAKPQGTPAPVTTTIDIFSGKVFWGYISRNDKAGTLPFISDEKFTSLIGELKEKGLVEKAGQFESGNMFRITDAFRSLERPEDMGLSEAFTPGEVKDIFSAVKKEILPLSLDARVTTACKALTQGVRPGEMGYFDWFSSQLDKGEFDAAYGGLKALIEAESCEGIALLSVGNSLALKAGTNDYSIYLHSDPVEQQKGGNNPWIAANLAMLFARACFEKASASAKSKAENGEPVRFISEAVSKALEAQYMILASNGLVLDSISLKEYSEMPWEQRKGVMTEVIGKSVDSLSEKIKSDSAKQIDYDITIDLPKTLMLAECSIINAECKLIDLEIESKNGMISEASKNKLDELSMRSLPLPTLFTPEFGKPDIGDTVEVNIIGLLDDPKMNNPWLKVGIYMGKDLAESLPVKKDKSQDLAAKSTYISESRDNNLTEALKFAIKYYSGKEATAQELAAPLAAAKDILSAFKDEVTAGPAAKLLVFLLKQVSDADALIGEARMVAAGKENNKSAFDEAKKTVLSARDIKAFIRSLDPGSGKPAEIKGLGSARDAYKALFGKELQTAALKDDIIKLNWLLDRSFEDALKPNGLSYPAPDFNYFVEKTK